jgi:hypothetical protein
MSVKGHITGYCVRVGRRPDKQMSHDPAQAAETSAQRQTQQRAANRKRRQQERQPGCPVCGYVVCDCPPRLR